MLNTVLVKQNASVAEMSFPDSCFGLSSCSIAQSAGSILALFTDLRSGS